MTPTNLLRFVERYSYSCIDDSVHTVFRLQQWWEDKDAATPTGEWRDVPLEQEE